MDSVTLDLTTFFEKKVEQKTLCTQRATKVNALQGLCLIFFKKVFPENFPILLSIT